ncbi:IS701 family transposase, partial [Micromonospora sp. LOL_027]
MVDAQVVGSWDAGLEELFFRFAHRFERVEPRRRAWAYMRGLLAPLERRNGWTLAEQAGCPAPGLMETSKPGRNTSDAR